MILYSRSGEELLPTNSGAKPVHVRKRPCTRCGGQGGAAAWQHTGWKCYRCGGECFDPNNEVLKLYTQEQLDKLNERKAIADEKRRKKKEESDRREAIRRDAEKAALISIHSSLIASIREELNHGDSEILSSVLDRIINRVKEPTERQIEVVNQIITVNRAERKRLEKADWIGTVGERLVFNLTLLYCRSEIVDSYPRRWSHWSLFMDDTGCKVASTSAPWVLGLVHTDDEGYAKGQKIKVKAAVKKHMTDKHGEPITYIQRPKAV